MTHELLFDVSIRETYTCQWKQDQNKNDTVYLLCRDRQTFQKGLFDERATETDGIFRSVVCPSNISRELTRANKSTHYYYLFD